MTLRQEKLNTLFRKLIAQFVQNNVGDTLVTITDVHIAKDLHNANAYIAVFPEDSEKTVLSIIESKQKELREFLKKNTNIKTLPHIIFKIDKGEKNRQKIDDLLNG